MRAWACLLLAVCLVGVRAADDRSPPASCGAAGLAGGWSAVSGDDADAVATEIVDQVMASFGANLTDALSLPVSLLDAKVDISAAGCQQVVAGMNYKLWINVTASTDNNTVVLGLDAEAYKPLPANGVESPIQLLDVDLNWLEVDGEVVVEDDGAGDDDKWEVDDKDNILANADWVEKDDAGWEGELNEVLADLNGADDDTTDDNDLDVDDNDLGVDDNNDKDDKDD